MTAGGTSRLAPGTPRCRPRLLVPFLAALRLRRRPAAGRGSGDGIRRSGRAGPRPEPDPRSAPAPDSGQLAAIQQVPAARAPGTLASAGQPPNGDGGSTRRHGHLGRFTRLRPRCGDWRAAARGCRCASLMVKRRAAAAAVRPCGRPDPGSPPSSFPQVTCLDRPGRPVLPPLFACEMRARPGLAVLAWSGDGSPVRGCTTTSGDRVPPRTLFRNDLCASIKNTT